MTNIVNCPACRVPMKLDYGRFGPEYKCSCGRGIRAHFSNNKPMGRPADPKTRRLRSLAHEAFDKIWSNYDGSLSLEYTRRLSYNWLAAQLGIHEDKCHIGAFNDWTCSKVIEICKDKTFADIINWMRDNHSAFLAMKEKQDFVRGFIKAK